MPADRVVVAHVAHEAAGARRQADQPELRRDLRGAAGRSARSARETEAASHSQEAARSKSSSAGPSRPRNAMARSGSRSCAQPPGRTRPRPKRLPHSSAVRFRKSPRILPQAAAVGRKATSPASAPRSPVWLASRSSSSAIARSHCARRGGSAPPSASSSGRVGGWRVRDRVVSPATVSIWLMRRAVRSAGERFLDAAVLVAERDLQVQHLLAGALEAEVTGLDDRRRAPGRPRPRGPRRPSTRKKSIPRPGLPPGRRTGFSHGCPAGTTPCCSAELALEQVRLRRA